jgi:hypothetical protein
MRSDEGRSKAQAGDFLAHCRSNGGCLERRAIFKIGEQGGQALCQERLANAG